MKGRLGDRRSIRTAVGLLKSARRAGVSAVLGLVRLVLRLLPLKQDAILFESFPELGGSPRMVYEELRRRGFGKRYRLAWAVAADFEAPPGFDCIPWYGKVGPLARIRAEIALAKAKAIVDSNRYIPKLKKSTYRLFTRHGAALKNCDWYFDGLGRVDCCLTLSENMLDAERKLFRGHPPRLENLGFPVHDQLFERVDLHANGFWPRLTGHGARYAKIIGWMPTYRQHRMDGRHDAATPVFPCGVPLLRTWEDFSRLNEQLRQEDILVAIQMHHAQAANFPVERFSHIVMVDPALKREMGVSTPCLMQGFDALVTDYSGAYHEFILLDRPVAISVDDYDTYAQNPGFALDFFDWIKGEYLKTPEDLGRFVENVAHGRDAAREARRSSLRKIHDHVDDRSTQRVTDLLCAEAGLSAADGAETR